jgi:hypothetical protein
MLLAKIGYKKPLYDFHPVLLENTKIIKILNNNKLNIKKISVKPQFSFEKIMAIAAIVLGLKKRTSYEKQTSVTDYGLGKAISHYLIIFLERIIYIFFPRQFGYFTKVLISNEKQ